MKIKLARRCDPYIWWILWIPLIRKRLFQRIRKATWGFRVSPGIQP